MIKKIIFPFLLIVIIATITFPHVFINPGKISNAHVAIKNNCNSCHQPFYGISDKKCISCHSLDKIGRNKNGSIINDKLLFHKELQSVSCNSCHTEHKGISENITLKNFNHKILNKSIVNNCTKCHESPTDNYHKQNTVNSCINCHTTINWKITNFDHTTLSNSVANNCVSCHTNPIDNFHQSNSNQNCKTCHSTNAWKPATFDHNKYFRFDNNHRNNCIDCHIDNNYKKYTCTSCHEHNMNKLQSEHNEEGIYNFNNCVECHRSGNEHEINIRGSKQYYINKENIREREAEDDD